MMKIGLCALLFAACASAPPRPTPAAPTSAAGVAAAMALRADAEAAYNARDYPRCADLFAKAGRAQPEKADVDGYSAACCFALAGDGASAFAQLDQALASGLRARADLEGDTDLASLRADPRWAKVLGGATANAEAYYRGANPELRSIHDADQADRRAGPGAINWAEVGPRDVARRRRVTEILDGGGAHVSVDFFHAAMVFQHGEEVADYRRAHELAVRAAELDPRNRSARWLAAAAKDRELMKLGQPQLYGTQFRKVGDVWELYQTDPTVTDDERARWNVPPIAEARRRAERMNKR